MRALMLMVAIIMTAENGYASCSDVARRIPMPIIEGRVVEYDYCRYDKALGRCKIDKNGLFTGDYLVSPEDWLKLEVGVNARFISILGGKWIYYSYPTDKGTGAKLPITSIEVKE